MVGSVHSDRSSENLKRRQDAVASFKAMRGRNYMLGIGMSTSFGWFEVRGFEPREERAVSALFIRSCSGEERDFAHEHTLKYTKCAAKTNAGDVIRQIVQIVPRPN